MKVDKIIETKIESDLEFDGAMLLSVEEAESLLTPEEREYRYWWWLRSPGRHSDIAAGVFSSGGVSLYGYVVNYDSGYVRPALKIVNLESSKLKIGDKFKIDGWNFKIISKDLAWMYKQDIGQEQFREDYFFDDANDYEKSDVKVVVDKWYENLIKENKND